MQVPEPVPADSLCDLRPDSGRLHIVSKARIRPVREFPVLVRAGEHIVGVQRIRDALTPLTQDREQIGSKGYRLSPGQRLRVPYVAVNDSPLNAEGSFVPVVSAHLRAENSDVIALEVLQRCAFLNTWCNSFLDDGQTGSCEWNQLAQDKRCALQKTPPKQWQEWKGLAGFLSARRLAL